MEPQLARDHLAFALDVTSLSEAQRWISRLQPFVGVFKVGLELFLAEGPSTIQAIHQAGARCFLDLKLHDIPATVAGATRSVLRYQPAYLTLHASGGARMVAAAREVVEHAGSSTSLLAVTVLTSLADGELAKIGFAHSSESLVPLLAREALDHGAHGIVCSVKEAAMVRRISSSACIATPGIRADGDRGDDQRRVATAEEALSAGASLLVVGRSIRDAAHPESVAENILCAVRSRTTR